MNHLKIDKEDLLGLELTTTSYPMLGHIGLTMLYSYQNTGESIIECFNRSTPTLFEIGFCDGQLVFCGLVTEVSHDIHIGSHPILHVKIEAIKEPQEE